MPLYEYLCDTCGERFEVIEKFSDVPLTTHDKCGGTVNRLLSAPALQFKGSGWYINDYAKASSQKETGSPKDSGSTKDTPATTSATKTDGNNSSTSTTPATTSKSTDSKSSTT